MNPKIFFTLLLLCAAFFISNQVRGQNELAIENIQTFAKVYGYVRFFHPSDEAATINWDGLAIYGCQRVEKARNSKELKAALKEIFKPIAPSIQFYQSGNIGSFNAKNITPADTSGYKVITWQHLGVGFGSVQSAYQSARTNRPRILRECHNSSANLIKIIKVDTYRNNEFKFTAFVRNTANESPGYLRAVVLLEDGTMGFYDFMEDRPIQKSSWTTYEIQGKIDSNADELYFGCSMMEMGNIDVDNFKVFIKEGVRWKEIYSNSFETDTIGKSPKDFYLGTKKTEDGKPEYQFLVSSGSSTDGKNCVVIKNTVTLIHQSAIGLFKEKAHIGEYIQEEIGSGLTCVIPIALYGKENFTFPLAAKQSITRLQKSLPKLVDTEKDPSNVYVRLADLVITWNIFQHYYPYFDVAKTDWNADFKQAVKQAYQDITEQDFLMTLRKFTAPLKDGHIAVKLPADKNIYAAPIAWEWVENQLVITAVLSDSLTVKRGDIVISINKQDPKHYFEEKEVYISAATKGSLQSKVKYTALLGNANSVMYLQVKDENGRVGSHALRRINQLDYFNKMPQADSSKQISPTIVYLNLDKISMNGITRQMPNLTKAKAIICDLRGYPNSNHAFISHLLSQKDTASRWMQIPQIIYPNQKKIAGYKKEGWDMEPKQPHLQAKIIFIIDGSAISYAESFMSFIEGYKLATIIGQPTAGTNGNINPFRLPGGYTISWTGMKVVKHNGSPHHGVGILPNIYLEKTIKGVREGRDEFLEKAIKLATQ